MRQGVSPHTREWTIDGKRGSPDNSGKPAHAGMDDAGGFAGLRIPGKPAHAGMDLSASVKSKTFPG